MDVMKNAWEVETADQAFLALAGHATREEFESDRRQHAEEIVQICSIDQTSRGFEVGSGEGTVARIVAGHCLSLDCNDISASFLEMARANCAQLSNVSFYKIESDYVDYLPAESYDFGYSLHVFIHFNLYDMFNYLTSIKRLLKPGGRFYFDAGTLGDQTITVFREQATMYRQAPQTIRGLLNFNHPAAVRRVVQEVGLEISDRSAFSEVGWMRVLTVKPATAEGGGSARMLRR